MHCTMPQTLDTQTQSFITTILSISSPFCAKTMPVIIFQDSHENYELSKTVRLKANTFVQFPCKGFSPNSTPGQNIGAI